MKALYGKIVPAQICPDRRSSGGTSNNVQQCTTMYIENCTGIFSGILAQPPEQAVLTPLIVISASAHRNMAAPPHPVPKDKARDKSDTCVFKEEGCECKNDTKRMLCNTKNCRRLFASLPQAIQKASVDNFIAGKSRDSIAADIKKARETKTVAINIVSAAEMQAAQIAVGVEVVTILAAATPTVIASTCLSTISTSWLFCCFAVFDTQYARRQRQNAGAEQPD